MIRMTIVRLRKNGEGNRNQIRRTMRKASRLGGTRCSCSKAILASSELVGRRAKHAILSFACPKVDGRFGVVCGPGRTQHGCSSPHGMLAGLTGRAGFVRRVRNDP